MILFYYDAFDSSHMRMEKERVVEMTKSKDVKSVKNFKQLAYWY